MLKLMIEYTQCYIKELLRDRSAAFFTLIFPAVLLLLFGKSVDDGDANKITYMIYCNYAVQSVMLQYLGITVSHARNSTWDQYLKILPVSGFPMIAGRVLSCLLFSLLSLLLVVLVYFLSHGVNLSLGQQISIIGIALLGGIPMALVGVTLGRTFKPAAARSVLILTNLLLLFGAFALSANGVFGFLRELIPSYQWLQLSTSIVSHDWSIMPVAWLVGYTILFYMFSLITAR